MKKLAVGLLAIAILGLGFSTIWVSAQNFGEKGFFSGDKDNRREQMFARIFNRIADELKLSGEQRSQAQQIIADSKERVAPLTQQLRQNHDSIENLGHDGTFNEARVNEIADQQAATIKQLIVEKEKTKAALFALLTPEQRTQAETMQNRFKEKMHGRGFHGMPPAGF